MSRISSAMLMAAIALVLGACSADNGTDFSAGGGGQGTDSAALDPFASAPAQGDEEEITSSLPADLPPTESTVAEETADLPPAPPTISSEASPATAALPLVQGEAEAPVTTTSSNTPTSSEPALTAGNESATTQPATTAAPATPAPNPVDDACPDGIASELTLVLSGATVKGNVSLGLAASPETPRNPCGSAEERVCFNDLNAERASRGLHPYIWDGDLADLARSHAADMKQVGYFGHGSSTNSGHLYQDRADFLGLKGGKFRSVVENSAGGYRSGAAVIDGWMTSSGHRAVILGEGGWGNITHVGCGSDGNNWNLEFGTR